MNRPLKVLILGQDPDMFERPGGAPNDTRARHLGYVRELQRRRPGSEVRIVVHTRGPGGPAFDRPFEGLEIRGTNTRSRIAAPLEMFRIIRRMFAAGWVPDVISCQTGYEEGLIAFLARRPGSRVQIQVHNDFYGDAFGGRNLVHRAQRWGIRQAIRRCDHARVVSTGIERAMIEAGDITPDRITVAPVPIVFAGRAPQPDPAHPVVLFVGRLVHQKDLPLWCAVARRIRARVPQAQFWVAGDGPERAVVERELGDFGAALRMFGAVAYDELPEIYSRASVFLLTSRYEGLGRVVVEAMMAAVPVVSADIVGPQDLIEDRVNGRLVPRMPEALAQACIDLLEDDGRARKIGQAGRLWAEAHYSFAAVTGKLVDSWESAADLPRRRP